MRIIAFCLALLIIQCQNELAPLPVDSAKVNALSKHDSQIHTYVLPYGIFRGVLYPSPDVPHFVIWHIKGKKEQYFEIPAPLEMENATSITDQWTIEKEIVSQNNLSYTLKQQNGDKRIQLVLPNAEIDYTFTVLENPHGKTAIMFLNPAESKMQRGIFGYVTFLN